MLVGCLASEEELNPPSTLPCPPLRGLALLHLCTASVLIRRGLFVPVDTSLLAAFNSPSRMEDEDRIGELCIWMESKAKKGRRFYLY